MENKKKIYWDSRQLKIVRKYIHKTEDYERGNFVNISGL